MTGTAIADLIHGFSVALQPHNFLACLIGVLMGNIVGVLPGMGVMAAISILLPLTFAMPPVAAILMLAGIYYGFLNVPMIGLWVKLLTIPYKYLYPSALFFVCIGVYSTNNSLFQVGETLVIGVAGYILLMLGFHPAPILLGFVLGPRFEENFRRAMLLSRGDLKVFIERPISAAFLTVCVILLVGQLYVRWRSKGRVVTVDAIAVEES